MLSLFYTVKCQEMSQVDNGNVTCNLGADGVYSYEDNCDIVCISGYMLAGSGTRMCLSNSSWSGVDAVCERGTSITKTICM